MTDKPFRAGWRRFWGALEGDPAAAVGFGCAYLIFTVVSDILWFAMKAIWTVTR